jgi:phage protein D
MFNYVTLEFPLSQKPPQRVSSFTLTQERYAHEVAVVKFRDWDLRKTHINPGEPVKCIIKGKNSSREFVGYIHDIKPEITPGKNFTTLTLIGASYKLKQQRQRVFENTTASTVIKSIAQEYGFSAYVQDHPRVYDQIVQAGHSELQFMARLAKQCGYSLRIQNTALYFQDLTLDFTNYRQTATSFYMSEANEPKGSTLYSFNLTLGESVQYADSYKSATQVAGVDPRTKETSILTAQTREETLRETAKTEFFDSYDTKVVAPSYLATLYEANSNQLRQRFAYRARVQVFGTPTIGPDKPVYLTGIGPEYSGYWIVLSAQHQIIETAPNIFQYTTFLEVGADSIGTANVWKDQTILAPSDIKVRSLLPNTRNVVDATASILTDGSQAYSNNGFTMVTNRSKPESESNVVPYVWVAERGTDSPSNQDTRDRSAAVVARLEAKGVL